MNHYETVRRCQTFSTIVALELKRESKKRELMKKKCDDPWWTRYLADWAFLNL